MPRRRKPPRLAVDPSELDVHKPDDPVAVLRFGEPDGLPADRFADKHQRAVPPDLPRLLDAAYLVRGVVPRLLEARRVGTGRRHLVPRRRLLVQRLMRAHGIELGPHPIEAPLLVLRRRGRRRRGLLLKGQMKPLVPPVLLGMPRVDPIELNPELQPPPR